RQSRARAGAAEGLRHGADDAEFAAAVGVAPAFRDLAEIVRVERLDRPLRRDALHDLARRHDIVELPAVRVADVHVFNESDDVSRAAEAAREIDDGVLVEPALDHRIDLDWMQTGG